MMSAVLSWLAFVCMVPAYRYFMHFCIALNNLAYAYCIFDLMCVLMFTLSEEMTPAEFNKARGINSTARVDHGLYAAPKGTPMKAAGGDEAGAEEGKEAPGTAKKGRNTDAMYYRITCKVRLTGALLRGA